MKKAVAKITAVYNHNKEAGMNLKRSIKTRLTIGIIMPLIIIILLFTVVIIAFVGASFDSLQWEIVEDKSLSVSDGAQSLADGTQSQTKSINLLTTSVGAMIEELKKSSGYAEQASKIADEEELHMNESKQKMEDLIEAIHDINNKSDEIGKIVQTIDSITKQTNMLSLNASIEAARAGEAGKGFAVVAQEVSDLAQKSAEASKNISVLINDTLNTVEKSVALVTESGEIQDIVVEKTKEANEIMRSIAKYANDHVASSASITGELDDITLVIQDTFLTAERSSALSQGLQEQAELLKTMVSKFKFE